MRIFALNTFMRFARKESINHASLSAAIASIESGLVDAELGGGLVKQRVARGGEGKRGGFRTIIAIRLGDRAVYLFGFAKNERDNISAADLAALKTLGKVYLAMNAADLEMAVTIGKIEEINSHD